MAKQIAAFRLSDEQRGALAAFADKLGVSESDVIRGIIPPAPWPSVFLYLGHLWGIDPLAVPARLAAEGLKRIIARDNQPIAESYLGPLVDPQAVADLALEWFDGKATGLGTAGPLGNRFRLVEGQHGFEPALDREWSVWPPAAEFTALLEDLRSGDSTRRGLAGLGLLRAGKGQHSPGNSELIIRAVGGDRSAVEELAGIAAEVAAIEAESRASAAAEKGTA